MKSMKAVTFSFVLGLFAYTASADDLFVDHLPTKIVQYAHLDPSSTIGGYPIYQGDGDWRFIELSSSATNTLSGDAESIKLGKALFFQPSSDGKDFAYMWVRANLTTTAVNQHSTGSPCAGPHLVAVNKVAGYDDNCMTIDVAMPQSEGGLVSHFWIRVTQNRTAGRSYYMALRLNAGAFGFGNTVPKDWSAEAVAAVPARKLFVDNLQQWGVLLQNGALRALEFSKPADAFSKVPPLSSLLPPSQALATQ